MWKPRLSPFLWEFWVGVRGFDSRTSCSVVCEESRIYAKNWLSVAFLFAQNVDNALVKLRFQDLSQWIKQWVCRIADTDNVDKVSQ